MRSGGELARTIIDLNKKQYVIVAHNEAIYPSY
jgi:hypothetical protein